MEKDENIKHAVVETYAEDMAEVIINDKEGLVKKIIHGEEEYEEEKIKQSPEAKKNQVFMFVGLIFILAALVISARLFFKEKVPSIPLEEKFTPLIFHDRNSFLEVKDMKRDEVVQTILSKVNGASLGAKGVEGIYLSSGKKIIGLREFLALTKMSLSLEGSPSDASISGDVNFVSDNFLMGVVNNKSEDSPSTSRDFFILLKVRSATDIFNPLRVWEDKMFLDLHEFWNIDISPETGYLLTKDFENGVVENKNARILYDAENKIVLMYVFADDTSVVITNTEDATREIMLRLAVGRVKK